MEHKKELTRYGLHSTTEDTANPQFTISEIADLFRLNGNKPNQPHIHDFYQIIWFRQGSGVHFVDFKEYPVEPDTLFFLSPGQVHYFDTHTPNIGIVIHFNESFLSDEGSSENVFLKYDIFNAFDAVPYYKVTPPDSSRLEHLCREMSEEKGKTSLFAHTDSLKYMLKLFLISIQRTGKRGRGIPLCINNSSNRTFVRFRQTLDHNYRTMHTVKEYAAHLNVSAKTLTNCCVESSHSTPLALINDRIALEAKRLLVHSDLKIKEIAFRLGFEEASYFVKFFKRQTGCLPTELRQ